MGILIRDNCASLGWGERKTHDNNCTWNPLGEKVAITEALVPGFPAGGDSVTWHSLDPHDAERVISRYRILIVVD